MTRFLSGFTLFELLTTVLVAAPLPPLDMPSPKFPPVRAQCICGPSCACPSGMCPNRCPVVSVAPVGFVPGHDWRHVPGIGWAWVPKGVMLSPPAPHGVQVTSGVRYYTFAPGTVTGGSSCPGGICPLPKR